MANAAAPETPGPLTPQAEVAVIVSTFNRAARLQRLLEGLRRQTLGRDRFQVLIVDNGSDDGTAALLDEASSDPDLHLEVLRHETNLAPALARDRGWRASRAPLLAFTDDDCVPEPGWLEAGLAAARERPGTVIQGWTEPDPADGHLAGPFSRTIRVTGPDPGFQTCNVFYPRAALEAVEGFDFEAFPSLGGEDSDLAWRAIEAGFDSAFVPEARVHHAISDFGPAGLLRVALRWGPTMLTYKRHRELRRRDLIWGVFWKRTHRDLFFALLGLVARPLPAPLRLALTLPYALSVYRRSRALGRPWWIPAYLPVFDGAETVAVVRGAARFRRPLF